MTDPTTTRRYRNRPAEIQAVQWTGTNADELSTFCSPFDFMEIEPEDRIEDPDETAAVRESEHNTWLGVKPGDWVLKSADGLTATSDEAFRAVWEPAAVLPPVDRAAVLNAAAQHLYTALFPAVYADMGQKAAEGVQRAVSELRRLAAEARQQTLSKPPIVAYKSSGGRLLHCLTHKPEQADIDSGDFYPVPSEDLPDGGICTYPDCGVDVLIPQEPQPYTPPAHYRRDDGVECCVHTIPVGPDSCRECRELADDGTAP